MSNNSICPDCNQRLLERCNFCEQPILQINKEEDRCKTCRQPLPEDTESESEVGSDEEEFELQKDETRRLVCGSCKRKLQECPECEQVYDSELDKSTESSDSDVESVPAKKRHFKSSEESSYESESEEDSEEEEGSRKRYRMRKRKNQEESDSSEESQDSNEEAK
ncbi:MAG: hypothetical protein FD143_3518 [Ignavibacteria bacterium]|nr:MAG: hypothetical protein FD143_3518 [Ignavibacteria bacterium]KAF0150133.1 MAG: hypothetical protein FD188_3483 [Ignavibacteria bacterium]